MKSYLPHDLVLSIPDQSSVWMLNGVAQPAWIYCMVRVPVTLVVVVVMVRVQVVWRACGIVGRRLIQLSHTRTDSAEVVHRPGEVNSERLTWSTPAEI